MYRCGIVLLCGNKCMTYFMVGNNFLFFLGNNCIFTLIPCYYYFNAFFEV